MNTLSLLPFAALILAACGGANEGANSAANPSTTGQAPLLLAAAGPQTMFDASVLSPKYAT